MNGRQSGKAMFGVLLDSAALAVLVSFPWQQLRTGDGGLAIHTAHAVSQE
jgi:hypothetical protein